MKWMWRLLVLAGLTWAAITVWFLGLAEYRSRAVLTQVERNPAGIVDFTLVGPSDWEKVYFFYPYSSSSHIDQTLGFHWPDADRSSIDWNDGINLVVFVRGGRVVGWFEHTRNRGDLLQCATGVGFSRDQARFKVTRDRENRAVLVQ